MIDFLRSLLTPMPTTSAVHEITSEADWTSALERSHDEPVLIFKHSNACSVSGRANRQIAQLTEAEDPFVYRITVQKKRALSGVIASELGIRHETPQAILLKDGEPVFDTSHFSVTAQAIREATGYPHT